MVRKHQQDLRDANSSKKPGNSRFDSSNKTNTKITDVCNSKAPATSSIEEKPFNKMTPATLLTPATAVMPPTAVTPTTRMMPATSVTPEAGTPAAAHEFCGDSQKSLK
jgi:hypothetical protein